MNRARQTAARICDEFEELLDGKDITIPSADREGEGDEARLYGAEYWLLEDAITDIVARALRAECIMVRQRLKQHK